MGGITGIKGKIMAVGIAFRGNDEHEKSAFNRGSEIGRNVSAMEAKKELADELRKGLTQVKNKADMEFRQKQKISLIRGFISANLRRNPGLALESLMDALITLRDNERDLISLHMKSSSQTLDALNSNKVFRENVIIKKGLIENSDGHLAMGRQAHLRGEMFDGILNKMKKFENNPGAIERDVGKIATLASNLLSEIRGARGPILSALEALVYITPMVLGHVAKIEGESRKGIVPKKIEWEK